MLENVYQRKIIKKLEKTFPGCIIIKNDPNIIQGFPDLLVLCDQKWAALEVKRSITAPIQPNQDFYIDKLNDMSYANFIYPENEMEVFDELQQTFKF